MDSGDQEPFNPREGLLRRPGIASSDPRRPFVRRLSVRAKLVSMIAVSIISLAGLGIFFFAAINEVKVSGPIYAAIAREMDLRSDILPPPEFIVETHLTVLQIAKALRSDPKQIDPLVKKIEGLKHDFDDRQSHWKDALPCEHASGSADSRRHSDGRTRSCSQVLSRYCSTSFFPAVKRADDPQANAIIDTDLAPLYLATQSRD